MYAQYLFNVKLQYEEAIQVLENLSASPFDVVELYPDIMGEEDIQPSERSGMIKAKGSFAGSGRLPNPRTSKTY